MRDLDSPRAGLLGRTGARVCAVLVAAGVGAGAANAGHRAAPASPATYGPTRTWGPTEVRSLDPPRRATPPSGRAHERPRPPDTRGDHALAHHQLDRALSDETTFTRWAYVDDRAPIRRQARATSPRMGRLAWTTEDGFSATYLVLRAHWDALGREWVKLRIPGRPNGRTGWVRREALGPFHLTHLLVIVNRERRRISVDDHGRRVWSAPVGVGARATPTPAGHFWINERFRIVNPRSGYYPYAFGTTDYSTLTDWPGGGVVGIHGPYYDPQGIPGAISHGCIRLEVAADDWLAAHMPLGTPVRVI